MTRSLHLMMDRLTRLHSAHARQSDLNAAQLATLAYLAAANRFSRSPSHVTEYLAATKGTVSQTLKSLAQKGLIAESRSETDRRSISYSVTSEGAAVVKSTEDVIDTPRTREAAAALEMAYRDNLGGRTFGLCTNCKWHLVEGSKRHCGLLNVALTKSEAGQICFEQEPA